MRSTKETAVMSRKPRDDKRVVAERVIRECFWGDYQLTAEELLSRLEEHDTGFDSFLFSKIIENSRQPSRDLPMLFAPGVLEPLLDRYLKMSWGRKRVRLVAANLTGRHNLVPELQWSR